MGSAELNDHTYSALRTPHSALGLSVVPMHRCVSVTKFSPSLAFQLQYCVSGRLLTMSGGKQSQPSQGGVLMLWTIAVILLVLWAIGLVSSYTMGGFIHILLVVAIVMVLVNLISGRRTVV